MKKILSILFVIVLLAVALTLVACGNEHTHEFTDTVIAPDCDKNTAGYTKHVCTCGYEYVDSYVEAHEFIVTVIPATCHDQGYTDYVCEECGYTKHDSWTELDPKNHVFYYPEDYKDATKAGKGNIVSVTDPTCIDCGYSTYACIYCKATTKKDIVSELVDHAWGEWNVLRESTCANQGIQERKCTVCGVVENANLPLADHVWGEYEFVVDDAHLNALYEERACIDCKTREANPEIIEDVLALELREDENGKYYVVTGINPGKNLSVVVIPAFMYVGDEKVPVREIESKAFLYNDFTNLIYIPDSVTKIGAFSLAGCTALETIVYGGLAAEWEAIEKVAGWLYGTETVILTANYK